MAQGEPVFVCPTYVGMNRSLATLIGTPAVCPTYVGMNRLFPPYLRCFSSMPHVCGDEPSFRADNKKLAEYAPRMWG